MDRSSLATERQMLGVKLARADRDLAQMFVRLGRCDSDTRRARMRKYIADQYKKLANLHLRLASEEANGRD